MEKLINAGIQYYEVKEDGTIACYDGKGRFIGNSDSETQAKNSIAQVNKNNAAAEKKAAEDKAWNEKKAAEDKAWNENKINNLYGDYADDYRYGYVANNGNTYTGSDAVRMHEKDISDEKRLGNDYDAYLNGYSVGNVTYYGDSAVNAKRADERLAKEKEYAKQSVSGHYSQSDYHNAQNYWNRIPGQRIEMDYDSWADYIKKLQSEGGYYGDGYWHASDGKRADNQAYYMNQKNKSSKTI